jgi:hypothetical protein
VTESALRATPVKLLADPFIAMAQTYSRKVVLTREEEQADRKQAKQFLSAPSSATFVSSDAIFVPSSSSSSTFVASASEPTIVVTPVEESLRVELESERAPHQNPETEVARLAQLCSELVGGLEKLTRMVEGERLYKRACECIYGMNGFRERSAQLGLSLLRGLTERGNEDAEYVYGRCLSEGTVVEADAGEVIRHLKVAAERANLCTLTQYGAALHAGGGVDRAKGIEFLERVVALGNAEVQVLLGRVLDSDNGIDKDEVRAA